MFAFEQRQLRLHVPAPDESQGEQILLTNSYASGPADGTYVHVTAGARRLRMRALRWLLRNAKRARRLHFIARLLTRLSVHDLLEGLRAADCDLVVSLDPAWTGHLRACLRRGRAEWPCLTAGEQWPDGTARPHRYDQEITVSIVLPTYNGTKYLAGAIANCLAQTHRQLELIVVDDGSGPEVAAIVAQFADARLKYVRHQINRGLPSALNTGFACASGTLLTWTSDDNLYAPDAIEQMVRFLCTNAGVDFVYTDAWEIDDGGTVVGSLRVPPAEWLKVQNRVGGCFLYRRVVYDMIGEYDTRAVLAEDYDYWLRIARRFTMQRLFRTLYYYRFHDQSLTGRCERQQVKQQAERVRRANSLWRRRPRLRRTHRAVLDAGGRATSPSAFLKGVLND
jgi:GT2 family glycosyltransferase